MSYSDIVVNDTTFSRTLSLVGEAKGNSSVAASVTGHDGKFHDWLIGATRIIEERTNRQVFTATRRFTLDRFPRRGIYLPRAPLQSVVSLKYIDTDGVQQTWDSSNYIVSTGREPGRICPAYGKAWPTPRQQADAIEIDYTCGFGSLPGDYQSCLMMMVDDWFNHRSGEGEISPWVASMLEQFRYGDEMIDYEVTYERP